MSVYSYIGLFLLVVLSGSSVFLLKNRNEKAIKLLLSFSGAYLFSISVLHLIPEIYSEMTESIGMYILIGFFLQIVLEYFSKGIEHGHAHHHAHEPFPFAVIISLCIHSFLEGMPLSAGDNKPLLIGIILHKIPISIVLSTMLLQTGMTKWRAFVWIAFFGLMLPMGAFTSAFIGNNLFASSPQSSAIILALVVGIFLHISTTILFESSENHKFNAYKLVTIVIGTLCAFFSH